MSMVGVIADAYTAPGGGGWTPASITGLQIWLDASDTASITHSSGAVSQWSDKSGNGYHFVNTTSAPMTGTRTVNGLNVIDFDGIANYLNGPTFILAQPFTVAAVAHTDDTASSGSKRIVGRSTASIINFGRALSTFTFNCGTALNDGGAWNEAGIAHRAVGLANGATSSLRFNSTVTNGNVGPANWTNTPQLGAINQASGFWDGPICEILIYNSYLAGTDLTNLETYLQTKWGTP